MVDVWACFTSESISLMATVSATTPALLGLADSITHG
jgi:hypothetical protein